MTTEANAEVGANNVRGLADEGGTVVSVSLVGNPSSKDGLFEGMMKTLSVFARVIGGVSDESTVVVDDDGEVGGEGVALGTGKFGARTEVGHPEIVWKGGFEGFAGAMDGVELGTALTKKASVSQKAVYCAEGRKVFAFVLVAPSLIGDFDRDLGMHFALFDEPGLLSFG